MAFKRRCAKEPVFNIDKRLKKWLLRTQDYFSVYGLKENKKGRRDIIEILGYY